jgi:hypothetical protein
MRPLPGSHRSLPATHSPPAAVPVESSATARASSTAVSFHRATPSSCYLPLCTSLPHGAGQRERHRASPFSSSDAPSHRGAPCSRLVPAKASPLSPIASRHCQGGYLSGLANPAGCRSGGVLYPTVGTGAGGGGGKKGRVRVWGCQTRP